MTAERATTESPRPVRGLAAELLSHHHPVGGAPMMDAAVPPSRPRRVVFVCVENSNRSQMAEAFARLLGGGEIEAYSAGSRPSGRVNPRAIAFMRERGYDLGLHRSKTPDDLPEGEFDVAVTMGCGDECPALRARQREEWDIPDPKELPDDEFRRVRDLIEAKVRELLRRLGCLVHDQAAFCESGS